MLPLPNSAKTGDGKKVGLDHDVDRCARRYRASIDSFFMVVGEERTRPMR